MFLNRPNLFILSFLVMIAFLFSCTSKSRVKRESTPTHIATQEMTSPKQVRAMNEKILMSALTLKREPYQDYKIGPDDLIEISVFEEEKLNKTVRVSSQGNITLPLLGILRVKGLTANELEKEIRELLAEKYLQNPNVTVFIKEYRSQRISVIGAVEKPGIFDITGQKTVLDMLAMAGGLKDEAGQLLFLIRPPGQEDEVTQKDRNQDHLIPKTFVIDLEALLVEGDMSLNLPLIHGDVLNIPISGKIFVGGEVNKPGGFPLQGKRITISQAIALAEGLKQRANGADTKIFRYSDGEDSKEILTVNLYAIQKGKAIDPYLRENDIVIVPQSGVKSFLFELRDTVKGLLGFGFSLGSL